jgi:hypothetical protein
MPMIPPIGRGGKPLRLVASVFLKLVGVEDRLGCVLRTAQHKGNILWRGFLEARLEDDLKMLKDAH